MNSAATKHPAATDSLLRMLSRQVIVTDCSILCLSSTFHSVVSDDYTVSKLVLD